MIRHLLATFSSITALLRLLSIHSCMAEKSDYSTTFTLCLVPRTYSHMCSSSNISTRCPFTSLVTGYPLSLHVNMSTTPKPTPKTTTITGYKVIGNSTVDKKEKQHMHDLLIYRNMYIHLN